MGIVLTTILTATLGFSLIGYKMSQTTRLLTPVLMESIYTIFLIMSIHPISQKMTGFHIMDLVEEKDGKMLRLVKYDTKQTSLQLHPLRGLLMNKTDLHKRQKTS